MILSPAKINLSIKVKKKLKNGYHKLSSHLIFLDLYDRISIKSSNHNTLKITGPYKNLLEQNSGDTLVSKSIDFCRKINLTNKNYDITLEKNIPISAGLGGGSSNSASIIRFFLRGKKISNHKNAIKDSKLLGADVPACIHSRPLFAEGIGEKISFINFNQKLDIGIVLINPNVPLSTRNVFENFRLPNKLYSGKKILNIDAIEDFLEISNIGNDLEETAIKLVPEIQLILNFLSFNNDCLHFGMSGSGPTCYGIFKNIRAAKNFKIEIMALKNFKSYWFWAGGLMPSIKRSLILPIK